ncbi:MAG: WxcM-like domain-containing protein [Candidatus Cloacimonadaceae bacterium]|nr:WxcM-like domain-containing protein [Candidatus Cloacimonadaceae bacterium]
MEQTTYKIKKNRRIVTKNRHDQINGYLVPIIDIGDEFISPEQFPRQVYLTVVDPGEIKGPHFHKERYAMYTCIKGNIKIVLKLEDKYEVLFSGEDHDYATLWIPAGIPTAVINMDMDNPSFILNTPNPSFLETPFDDHNVEFDPSVLNNDA